jgi:virginiamycin A acetyltransferase
MQQKKSRTFLYFVSAILNKLLSYYNPVISILNSDKVSLIPIRNRIIDSRISKLVKLYPPYKIEFSDIGDYSYIAENSRINQTRIGKFCSIGPNLLSGYGIHPIHGISTSPMFYSTLKQNGYSLSKEDKITERKPITIGNDVFIGMNVTILDGISIGDGAVIGAGCIVSKDIPPYTIAIGVPVQIIRKRFTDEQIEKLLKIKWWNFQEMELQEVEKFFFDVDAFIDKYS